MFIYRREWHVFGATSTIDFAGWLMEIRAQRGIPRRVCSRNKLVLRAKNELPKMG
jgi:hypothetical protein